MKDKEFFLDNQYAEGNFSKPLADSPYVRMYLACHNMPITNANKELAVATENTALVSTMVAPIQKSESNVKFAPVFVFLTSLLSVIFLFAGILIESIGIFVKEGKIVSAYNIISDFVASLSKDAFSLGGMLPFFAVMLILLGAVVAMLSTMLRFKKSYCNVPTIISCSFALIGSVTLFMLAISAITFPIGVAALLVLTLLAVSAAVLPKRKR